MLGRSKVRTCGLWHRGGPRAAHGSLGASDLEEQYEATNVPYSQWRAVQLCAASNRTVNEPCSCGSNTQNGASEMTARVTDQV